MTIKDLIEKFKLKGKKTAAIVGMSAALSATAVGCGQKEVVVEPATTTESVDETAVIEEETPVVETPVVEEPVVTPAEEVAPVVEDKEIVVEEVTLDMLNTRLAELIPKYEGTYTEDNLRMLLGTANCSYANIDDIVAFTNNSDVQILIDRGDYVTGLILNNDYAIGGYYSTGATDKTFLNPADLYFNTDLIEMGNWIYNEVLTAYGPDSEKANIALKSLINYYIGQKTGDAILDKAPIGIDNEVFSGSANLYINSLFSNLVSLSIEVYPTAFEGYEISGMEISQKISKVSAGKDFTIYMQGPEKSK